jgi:hypothetical protein
LSVFIIAISKNAIIWLFKKKLLNGGEGCQ